MSNSYIHFSASDAVRAALGAIDRTEDVAVSPDGSRLALAAFTKKRVYVFSLVVRRFGHRVNIQLPACIALTSNRFSTPHGCTFLDRDHLLVCDREGDVTLVRLPEPQVAGGKANVAPQLIINGRGYLKAIVKTPGSVVALRIGEQRYRAFICSDQWHFITSHIVTLGPSSTIVHEGIRIQDSLQIPDGISISPDRHWIAVSNHVQGHVLLFHNSTDLNVKTAPTVVLEGSLCPHGLSFDADGNLYVADAASPYIHRFKRPPAGWEAQKVFPESFRLLSNNTFYKGRYAAREGGIKGLHIDQRTNVLITTHKLGPLEFYDLENLQTSKVDAEQIRSLQVERDAEIQRTKTDVLTRRWTLGTRLQREIDALYQLTMANLRAINPLLDRIRLQRANRLDTETLLDPAGPVVSMTSHSTRIEWAHLAIESIARGTLKPKRLLLWLPEEEVTRPLSDALLRLKDRGLEIHFTRDLGPHTKYFPYVASETPHSEYLVTADDDIIYPRSWLAALMHAHKKLPDCIHCHRARRMRLNPYHFEPYGSWEPAKDRKPSPLNFLVGASGVIYPPAFLDALRGYGTDFLGVCPTADDIWLNRVAYREGFLITQVATEWLKVANIPASQSLTLSSVNMLNGGNQLQLANTYSPEERASLFRLTAD